MYQNFCLGNLDISKLFWRLLQCAWILKEFSADSFIGYAFIFHRKTDHFPPKVQYFKYVWKALNATTVLNCTINCNNALLHLHGNKFSVSKNRNWVSDTTLQNHKSILILRHSLGHVKVFSQAVVDWWW